jgi:Fe-S oxidoreductase
MSRPDDRPLRRLPQLAPAKATLERCVFCPKLCRSACPVSNAEPRETVTPWGKMSMAYFTANESVPLDTSHAAPAWACTGCFGCREHCDHENDVTGTLFTARSAIVETAPEAAPPAALRVIERFGERSAALRDLRDDPRIMEHVDERSGVAVLVGCAHERDVAIDIVRAVARLSETKVALVDECCGAPLLHAGDGDGFTAQGTKLAALVADRDRVIVADAGCASALGVHHRQKLAPRTLHFTELAAHELTRIPPLGADAVRALGRVRWHDPCQLGRGLGLYEPPRQVLSRLLGRPAEEFPRRREDARCSGGGGLVPVTMPETARTIATQRTAEHEDAGGGTIVTACASSARSFARAGADVVDVATLVARALT